MCGIVGYAGPRPATPILVRALHDLEYRGYDSAGIAVLVAGRTARSSITKRQGKIANLESALAGGRTGHRQRPASATRAGRPTASPATSTPTPT